MPDLWLLSFIPLMSDPLSVYQLDCHYILNQSKLKQGLAAYTKSETMAGTFRAYCNVSP